MKKVIITEEMAKYLREESEMTEFKFLSNIRKFLADLLNDPIAAMPCFNLTSNGLDKFKLLRLLDDNSIILKNQRINDRDDDGNLKTATMRVKYRVPKKNFERKIKKLFISLFEENLPKGDKINETTGCCGGCAGGECFSNSGSFEPSLSGTVVRRKKKNKKKTH